MTDLDYLALSKAKRFGYRFKKGLASIPGKLKNGAANVGKGIVGIYIHNLKDDKGNQCNKGYNPFDYIITSDGRPLSVYVRCYDPPHSTSKRVYEYIEENINAWIEDAIDNTAP